MPLSQDESKPELFLFVLFIMFSKQKQRDLPCLPPEALKSLGNGFIVEESMCFQNEAYRESK